MLPKHVLLTGATGFIGRAVLSDLLALEPSLHVTCLVRANDNAAAFERLKAAFHHHTEIEERVHVVCGHLGVPNPPLGLAHADVEKLRQFIAAVVHCGAFVNHILPFTELEACNVTSVRHLINMFGCERTVKVIYAISCTFRVFP